MSRKASSSSAGSSSSSAMSSFSSLHSRTMNRLMLSPNVSEFKRVAKSEKIDIRRVEDDGTSLLHWFCSSGRQEIVQYLLQSRVPITKNETNGQSPLHCVVDSNDRTEDTKRANIVQFLIHAGVAVDAQDINGWTALKLACRSGLYQCASMLLNERADAEKRDHEGNTALHDGVRYSDVTRLLISYVDNIDVVNYDSDTPLLLAVKTGAEESVRYLAHAGADVNIENGYGQFPLMLATESKNTNVIQILLDAQADVDKVEPKDNMTALHRAALNKTWQVCVLLVRHGANSEIQDNRGVTALDYAMKLCPDMADQLRDEAAKQKSEKSAAVLEVVFEQLASGRFDRLPQLLENLPDVNVQIHGHSLIHLAVAHFQFDSVVLLQRKGANLNAQMPDGNTPLHLTCQGLDKRHESLRILRFLVSSGVLLDTRNRHGETALFLAAGSGLVEHQCCLQNAGADFLKMNNRGLLPLHIACSIPETVNCIQRLLECAPDTVNAPDGDGWTPLMYASKTGCPDTVKLLLDFGAHVNAQEPTKGHTALYLSVISKSFEVCQLLVAHGANIDVRRGPRMITAFHRAAMDNLTDMCFFFAEQGGNIWQKDDKGNCPLDLVASPTLRRRLEERSPLKGRGMWQIDGRSAMSRAGASTGVTSSMGQGKTPRPGRVLRVEADVHIPPEEPDPTPDSIHRQPIQFVNGRKDETAVSSPLIHEVAVPNAFNTDQSHPPQYDAMPARATPQGSPRGSRTGGCHVAAGELTAENRMGAPHIHKNDYVIQSNLSQIVASGMNTIQQPLPSIEFHRDTGRRQSKKPTAQQDLPLASAPAIPVEAEDVKRGNAAVDRIARVVDRNYYSGIEKHRGTEGRDMNEVRVPPVDADARLDAFPEFGGNFDGVVQQNDFSNDTREHSFSPIDETTDGLAVAQAEAFLRNLSKNTPREDEEFEVISSEEGNSEDRNIPPSDKEESLRVSLEGRDSQVSEEDLRPSWQLGKDEVQTSKLIGSGGFGEVFEGKCRGKQVAVKMMRNRGGPLQDKIVETFFSEVEIMSKLKHEYVTEFVGACFDEDLYCIVTELMKRGSVFDLLHKRATLRWPRRIEMTSDAAKGMDYLHSLNVLHRDMKSMNLLVNNDWKVKVADFGLTRFKQHTQTMMSSTRGTPAYMAPELLHNRKVSEKIDVYAFGIVMSEIATRAIPFGDQNMNPLQLMFAVCQGSRPTLPREGSVPPDYVQLARFCWAERPDDRPNFGSIVRRLDEIAATVASSSKYS